MSVIGDIFGGFSTIFNNERSLAYQKNLQQQLFERDDTAMQRRMADFSAAGINPLLAIGASGAGNTSAGGVSFQNITPTADLLERKARVTQNNILEKKETEQDSVNESLWLKNEEQKLKNKMLEKEIDTMETLDYYPLSALGKWTTDMNKIFGLVTGQDMNFLNPINVFKKIFSFLPDNPGPDNPGVQDNDSSGNNNPVQDFKDSVNKKVNDVKVNLNPTSKDYKISNKTNKALAETLDKTWIDSSIRVNFYNGKFHVESFRSMPPETFEFDTYQQASQFIWSFVN